MTTVALIPLDMNQCSLGLPWNPAHVIHGRNVLAHTLARVARIEHLQAIVLLHPADQDPSPLLAGLDITLPVHLFPVDEAMGHEPFKAMRLTARKTSPDAWRGGLGGMTIYDEILTAKPMLLAMEKHQASAAVLIGAGWLLLDPVLTTQVLNIHLQHPEAMQIAFSQAPPGLAGLAISKELLKQFAENDACIGQVVSYNPQRPQADPIGRDVCAQIPATVRDCPHRVIYDLPRCASVIDQLANLWDADTFENASAIEVASGLAQLGTQAPASASPVFLPREITMELTSRRTTNGPLLPQFHLNLSRPDMTLDTAKAIFSQLTADQDTWVIFGGLGDALLHPQWEEFVAAARSAGVMGICIETDLLVDESVLEKLLDLPIDIITVRINADTSATYRTAMSPDDETDHFKTCIGNLQWLINHRNGRWQKPDEFPQAKPGLPWIVPSMVKTRDTLGDMETFFDRWMVYTSAAVIAPFQTGCGKLEDQSPVHMTPPRRRACRQLASRLTILSDGSVAQCDQDWLSEASPGEVTQKPLREMLASLQAAAQLHAQGQWDELNLCARCDQWHRP